MTTVLLGPVGCAGCEAPVELVRFLQVVWIHDDERVGVEPYRLKFVDFEWCDVGTTDIHRCPRNRLPYVPPVEAGTRDLVAV